MFAGDIIWKNEKVYLRTVDGEELIFLWQNKALPANDLRIRLFMSEYDPICFVGIRVDDTFNALRVSR